MKVGRVGTAASFGYIPLDTRIENFILAQIRRAHKAGKSKVDVILKDNPATMKALNSINQHFEVSVKKSDSLKATIKF